MGIFGDSSNNSTTSSTTTVNPWGPQGTALKEIYGQAGDIFDQQQKLGPLGFDPSSVAALSQMQNLASGYNPLVQGAMGAVGGVASGDNSIRTGDAYRSIANGPGINPSHFNELYQNNARGDGMLQQGLFGQIASGGMLSYPRGGDGRGGGGGPPRDDGSLPQGGASGAGGGGNYPQTLGGPSAGVQGRDDMAFGSNPYREQAIKQSMDDTMNQINARFTGAGPYSGRMGSSAYGDYAARQLGNVATSARMQGYDTDIQNMMQASQAASGENLARQGLGMQAAQGSAGVAGQNIQNQLAATQGLTGVQGANIANSLQAAGMAPTMNTLKYDDANHLAQVGGAKEAMAQQQRDFGQQNLQNYSSIVGGVPGQAGQSQTQQPGQGWLQTLLGLGGAGLGLAGLFGGLI